MDYYFFLLKKKCYKWLKLRIIHPAEGIHRIKDEKAGKEFKIFNKPI